MGLGHARVGPGSQAVSAARPPPPARPEISKAMTAAPQGPDLSFLNEEEARAIFGVLQRDSELRRAEKDRVRYQPEHPRPSGLRRGAASARPQPEGGTR